MQAVEEFEQIAGSLRRELVAHCYRMVGSADDAEDLVQETYLRAWRAYGGFQGRSSVRTWLYQIATNVCLTEVERRGRRPLPAGLGPPGQGPGGPAPAPLSETAWLQPFPGPVPPASPSDPAAVVASRAGLRLALVAGLQFLPARQRAVLILRDVLEWSAAETAETLDTSTTAVHSMLRRARAHLRRVVPDEDEISESPDVRLQELLGRYAAAFENADLAGLVALLREDVTLEMPPLATWYAGITAVERFLGSHVLLVPGAFRLLPVVANGQPAFATYQQDPDGTSRAHAIQVLSTAGGRLTRIVIFLDPGRFAGFGLPQVIEPATDTTCSAAGPLRGRRRLS